MPWYEITIKLVRPVLTYGIFFIFVVASTVAAFYGLLDFGLYQSQIGTMVGMIVSFWFGERSALKKPGGDDTVPTDDVEGKE